MGLTVGGAESGDSTSSGSVCPAGCGVDVGIGAGDTSAVTTAAAPGKGTSVIADSDECSLGGADTESVLSAAIETNASATSFSAGRRLLLVPLTSARSRWNRSFPLDLVFLAIGTCRNRSTSR